MARDFSADIQDDVAKQIVNNVGVWVDKEVKPNASEFEHHDEFPEPLLKGMSDMGLFGIKIPDEDAQKLTTVGQAVDYVVEHQ